MPPLFTSTGHERLRVIVFTSTRADSGILSPFIAKLSSNESVDLLLLATGTHLEEEFGRTLEQEMYGLGDIRMKLVDLDLGQLTSLDWSRAMSQLLDKASLALEEFGPDVALILGDRSEALTFAVACNFLDVPIAHFHGGEVTGGAKDEFFRHAISKLSSLHFPTSREAANRLIQMGEVPETVFFFAPLFLSQLASKKVVAKDELAAKFSFKWGAKTALVAMHGAKFDRPSTEDYLDQLLQALGSFPELNLVFTGPNADTESIGIRRKILEWVGENESRAFFVESFGSANFVSMLRHVDFAIGNSSSLVLEAPLLGTPTALLGDRQQGRGEPRAKALPADSNVIKGAISALLGTDPSSEVDGQLNDPTARIVRALLEFDYSPKGKEFYDFT